MLRVYYWVDMFILEPDILDIRSRVLTATKERLLAEYFDLPSKIVESQNARRTNTSSWTFTVPKGTIRKPPDHREPVPGVC